MGRHQLLLSAAIQGALFLAMLTPLPMASSTGGVLSDCTPRGVALGHCPEVQAQVNNGGVDVSATQGKPGSGTPGSNKPGSGAAKPEKSEPPAPQAGGPVPGGTGWRDPYTVTSPVTLADLVNFKPSPGVDHMEPNGWMIVGLDTNFYAVVGSQVKTGMLLGKQASVRFMPRRYHWTYGDGHGATLASKGGTWGSQGVHEFDRTPTSHVYTNPGTYIIDLSIDFSAEYRYVDSDWIPVAGTINVPANPLTATAGAAKTVLVERDCTVPPVGPGC